ncbi:sensor domain-containing diguanylate cyclase [Guyparkeria hydrothermalis]|uniref:sensor domain-containing diguanylate cyclase n=1 Tax=Guyparkeria TaxID=2035712 RepID=UPI0010ABA8C0|nr:MULTISPECIES: sensor domain-containing diguanylate cyclase [Guyparkeria]MCL7750123.1 sensor domain-containing diguanylate cyclase [Guyparkeria hydrothermalis]TKA89227.1 sensor domain-containing diguanylate cyclase [Guyparkeria sp. SB14A]
MTNDAADVLPFGDFDAACRAVLAHLSERTGLGLWMMTRTEGEDWIVLQAEGDDERYSVAGGDVLRWADSFCSLMVGGRGPQAAPRAAEVAAYRDAPIGRQVPIGAYVGVPVMRADGELFGTLCAIDPDPQPEALNAELPLVRLFARLLGSILETELRGVELARTLETVRAEASLDPLTGLLNRRGWEERVEIEERRARRYGSPATVFIIDLDRLKEINDSLGHDAGDDLLIRAGQALRTAMRETDAVARIGGDEFAVLCMESGTDGGRSIEAKVRRALAEAGVEASVGWAARNPRQDIESAVVEADREMLDEKRAGRKQEADE